MRRLRDDFAHKNHKPSPEMWDAIADIVRTLEDMADEKAERKVHLASLDPGVGKTQSVVHFLPVLRASKHHASTGVIVCAGRRAQIKDVIKDAKVAGLSDDDFAVYTSDDALNSLGRGEADRNNAPVLFTTHAMVMKRCEGGRSFTDASDFHYLHQPREVRVWDEAITPGLVVRLSNYDLSSLIKPVSFDNPKLADRLIQLLGDMRTCDDGKQFAVPDLRSDCDIDLNDLERLLDDNPTDQKIAANALWFLCGKVATLRFDGGRSRAILDYEETFPPGLKPLLVLDASSRRDVRETYNQWEKRRGGIKRLIEAHKNYMPLTIHHWQVSGGKTAFNDRDKRRRLIQGIAATINGGPSDKWLVVHHKDKNKYQDFESELLDHLDGNADVAFLHWGAHDAINDHADRPNVILAGTLFLRPSVYEALGRAAAARPSSSGPFPKQDFERVRRGEHRHMILQAACRGMVRKCNGDSCPQSHLYIIASRGSHIGDDLQTIFPGAQVVRWQPVQKTLTGKVGAAVRFILERTTDGSFVADREVMAHIGTKDKSNYNRRVKKHQDLIEALAEQGIEPCKQGRLTGFQRLAAYYFGETSEQKDEKEKDRTSTAICCGNF